VFVLAKIVGHSSITITQHYVHPRADAIGRVFSRVQTRREEVPPACAAAAPLRRVHPESTPSRGRGVPLIKDQVNNEKY
jgi:hypothetical protein